MSMRRNFSYGGFMTGVGLSAACAMGLLALKQCAWSLGEGGWLPWNEFVAITSMSLLSGVWFGAAMNRSLAMEGVRFLKRCRRGEWLNVFGFACSTAFAGVLLGIVLSFPKWFYLPGEEAWMHAICLSGASAIVGFVGGFGAQFAPQPRRAAR